MTMTVSGPGGLSVQFPDGTDPTTINRVMSEAASHAASAKMQEGAKPPPDTNPIHNGTLEAIGRGAGDMFSFGFGDEIAAGIKTLGGLTGDYQGALDEERRKLDKSKEEHPIAFTAGQVAGAVPSLLVPGGGVARGAGLVGKVGAGLVRGGLEGAAYGFGSGTDLGSRAEEAAGNSVAGAALGSVAAPVGAVVGRTVGAGVNAIRNLGAKESPGVERAAAAFGRDSTPEQRLTELGPDAMLMDAGPNLSQQAATITTLPGKGQDIVRDALTERKAGASARVQDDVSAAMGPKSDLVATADTISKERAAISKPLYDKAYATPIEPTDEMMEVLQRPAGKAALNRAIKLAADEGIPLTDFDTKTFDYVKRALDDAIAVGRRQGKNQEVQALDGIRKTIVKGVDEQNPTWASARRAYAGPSEVLDAIQQGQSVFQRTLSPDELRAELAELSVAGRQGYLQGARQAVEQIMGTARNDAGAAARELADRGWNREKLAVLVGPQQADRLVSGLRREQAFANTTDRVTRNSETAARLAGKEDFVAGVEANPNSVRSAYQNGGLFGLLRGGTFAALDSALGGMSREQVERAAEEAARLLTAKGRERDRAISILRNAASRQNGNRQSVANAQRALEIILAAGAKTAAPPLGDTARSLVVSH